MHKIFMVLMVISILAMGVISCEPIKEDVITPVGPITATPVPEPMESTMTLPANPTISTEAPNVIESKMMNVVWLTPGKVNIDGLFAGGEGDFILRVHNPHNKDAVFSIYVKEPNYTATGYEKLPSEYYKWVNAGPTQITVPLRATVDIPVTVTMGLRDRVSAKKYEVWIGVKDTSQTAMVQTEVCNRILITTR